MAKKKAKGRAKKTTTKKDVKPRLKEKNVTVANRSPPGNTPLRALSFPYQKSAPEKLMFGLLAIILVVSVLFFISGAQSPTGATVSVVHAEQVPYPDTQNDENIKSQNSLAEEMHTLSKEIASLKVQIKELQKALP